MQYLHWGNSCIPQALPGRWSMRVRHTSHRRRPRGLRNTDRGLMREGGDQRPGEGGLL